MARIRMFLPRGRPAEKVKEGRVFSVGAFFIPGEVIMFVAPFRTASVFVLWGLCLSWAPCEAPKKKPKDKSKLSAIEQEIVNRVNAERKKEDLPPLKLSPLLTKAARDHSANMASQGKMDHVLDGKNPLDRVRAAGYRPRGVGENIGEGAPSAAKMMAWWMNSKLHRGNILNSKFKEIGVGVVRDERGRAFYTQ